MTHLIVECDQQDSDWCGADGLLTRACDLEPEKAEGLQLVLLRGSPESVPQWAGAANVHWLVEQGLDAAARLRDLYPGERFLPAVTATRPSTHFTMGQHYTGDGFSYYVPDMTTYRTYRIDDGDVYLSDWLERVSSLGFDTVLFNTPDAKADAKGFDLDLLEKAKRLFQGRIILSGEGAGEPVHFERLKEQGCCFAALLPQAVAARLNLQEIVKILVPPAEGASPQESEGAAA
ncbi:MAG: hypothetical protein HQL43_06445 [Alphaproteobacteria bacterium]|nr:hypothetical protein [Alphaproteobacteria bacterium]